MNALTLLSSLNFFAIGLGAALGAWLRWGLGLLLNPLLVGLPLGTLAANLLGGYLIGVAVGLFHLHAAWPVVWKLAIITGFLGGLTTFSSFSAEVVERLLAGQWGWACAVASLHLIGSLSATYAGLVSVGATRFWG